MNLQITHAGIFSQDMIQWDADAADYLARVAIADGQALEPAVAEAVNELFVGLKDPAHPAPTEADHFSILSQMVPLCGARTLAGAEVPLKATMPSVIRTSIVSGDYNRKTGVIGNGSTKWYDLGVRNTIDNRDDSSMFIVVSSTPSANGHGLMGANSNPAAAQRRIWGVSFDHNTGVNNSATNAAGFRGISRHSSSEYKFRINGGTYTAVVASVSNVSTAYVALLARDISGATPADARVCLAGLGKSADLNYLDSIFTSYLAALAAAIL